MILMVVEVLPNEVWNAVMSPCYVLFLSFLHGDFQVASLCEGDNNNIFYYVLLKLTVTSKIPFVSNEHDNHVGTGMLPSILEPCG